MKTFNVSLVFVLLAFSVNAQLKTDKGLTILPEVGDWAVGVYTDDEFTITVKKVKDLSTHKRYRLRLGFNSNSTVYKVQDDVQAASNPNATVLVDDKVTNTTTDIMFMYGLEKRRGKGRVQGFYGVEGGVGLTSQVTKHDFANGFVAANVFAPSTAIPDQDGIFPRTTEINSGTGFQFAFNGFVGAEYFFLDKVSLGLEWAYGAEYKAIGEGSESTEEYDQVNSVVVSKTSNTGKQSNINFSAADIMTRFRLLLYFN